MKILIKNEYGSFEIGGGSHSFARLKSVSGLAPPQKERKTSIFANQPGQTTHSVRDMSRTITLSFDFDGEQRDIERLYRLIYYPVEIILTFGTKQRKIRGLCTNPQDVESIIFQKKYSCVLQFMCDNPYFNDAYNINVAILQREDRFPNVLEDGKWYIELPAVATIRTAAATIRNNGEVAVYPTIYLYNHKQISLMSLDYGIEVKNKTNGAKITLNYKSIEGETIIIDLEKRKITSDIFGNITNKISDDTVLSDFVLNLGENEIECINLDGISDLTVIVEYTNKYASAVIM